MEIIKNIVLNGKHNKPIVADCFFKADQKAKPIVIFCHGYKGFKDWGAWNLVAEKFAEAGFFFIKFNFSHNGGTVEQPIDFPDLEAFGNNNYTKELDDLETVINWIDTNAIHKNEVNTKAISIIGHSRGGGIVCIKAEEDSRVKKVISWAGVCDYKKRTATSGALEQWKKDGVKYVLNGRTQQKMPHFYQFYEDFIANEDRLNIQRAVQNLKIPYLIIHGDHDTSVTIEEAFHLKSWNSNAKLYIVNQTNHVFEMKHPWLSHELPKPLEKVLIKTIDFLKN